MPWPQPIIPTPNRFLFCSNKLFASSAVHRSYLTWILYKWCSKLCYDLTENTLYCITKTNRLMLFRGKFLLMMWIIQTRNNNHHKHQELDPLIRSVSRVTVALSSVSSVFQLFSFLVVCSGMISRGFGFVAFFASIKASLVCIHLSCLVCT
jgi:hypothetical protein